MQNLKRAQTPTPANIAREAFAQAGIDVGHKPGKHVATPEQLGKSAAVLVRIYSVFSPSTGREIGITSDVDIAAFYQASGYIVSEW